MSRRGNGTEKVYTIGIAFKNALRTMKINELFDNLMQTRTDLGILNIASH